MNAIQTIKSRAKVLYSKWLASPFGTPCSNRDKRNCIRRVIWVARQEAADAARIAALSPAVRAERIAEIKYQIQLAQYIDSTANMIARRTELRAELARLAA